MSPADLDHEITHVSAPQGSGALTCAARALTAVFIRGGALASAVALLVGGCMATSSPGAAGPMIASGAPFVQATNDSIAGHYLAVVGGCNDCHTVGWAESNGATPPAEQLTGSSVGYRGPWGTTYPANLRAFAQRITEDRWVQILTTANGGRGRPPMPWMNTAAMNRQDLRAMYRYVHSLGAAGGAVPRAVPPDSMPRTPYINFVPVPVGGGK